MLWLVRQEILTVIDQRVVLNIYHMQYLLYKLNIVRMLYNSHNSKLEILLLDHNTKQKVHMLKKHLDLSLHSLHLEYFDSFQLLYKNHDFYQNIVVFE